MTNIEPGLLGIAIFLPMIFSLLVIAYVAHTHVDRIEAQLSKSSFVSTNRKALSAGGLPGKLIRISSIAFLLVFPALSARRGLADADELNRFPSNLKRALLIPWTALLICAVALIIL
ncbi:hypothetical protein BW686_23285 [Pseudomonas syringae]|uniref:Uncharacterized protein n=1 Tax=Pseudomonas syringae TaxID=317 RepID=A0A244EKI7_PSESX|nr:hypothetical protein BW686_23285 [Pseudomonas syringae]